MIACLRQVLVENEAVIELPDVGEAELDLRLGPNIPEVRKAPEESVEVALQPRQSTEILDSRIFAADRFPSHCCAMRGPRCGLDARGKSIGIVTVVEIQLYSATVHPFDGDRHDRVAIVGRLQDHDTDAVRDVGLPSGVENQILRMLQADMERWPGWIFRLLRIRSGHVSILLSQDHDSWR